MPYDPNFPPHEAELLSADFRAQFNGLKALIDAIPAGPQGVKGDKGDPFANVIVDGVNLLPQGALPTIDMTVDGADVHLLFGIPEGPTGSGGPEGPQGAQGPQGVPGPAFASVVVDSVTTLPAGADATVTVTYDGNTVHLALGLPRGADGPAGEVSLAQLNAAMDSTLATAAGNSSANSNAVPTLDVPFIDPDMETLRQAFNTLVLALRR